MNRKRPHFVQFGPAIPVVPLRDFSKMGLTHEQWADAWHICGPSAGKNLERLELWQVIASAYLEGLQHGSEMQKEIQHGTTPRHQRPVLLCNRRHGA